MDQEKHNNSQPIENSPQQATQAAGPSPDNEPTPPSINEQENTQIIGKKDSKINKKTIIVGSILVCVLFACIIGIIIATSTPPASNDQVSDNSQTEQDESSKKQRPKKAEKPATTAEGLPDCSQIQDQAELDVCTTISSVAEYLVDRNYPTDGQIVLDYSYKEDEGPIYKPDYLIMPTRSTPGHRAYVLESRYTSANEYLLENGFIEVSRTTGGGLWKNETYINYENGVICEGTRFFSCGNIMWYPAEGSENVNLLNDLARVGIRDEGWDAELNELTTSTDKIENSEFAPYQTIGISGFNAGVSFYRTSPTDEWRPGYAAQTAVSCDHFDNLDKQKAYASMPCQMEGTDELTTVKEYYNL